MNRLYLWSGVIMTLLVGCSSHHTPAYYRTHPKAVFTEVEACLADTPKPSVHCRLLEKIAQTFRPWIAEIQTNPQQFGQQIMHTQMRCAEALASEEKQACQEELAMRFAVVKWLESPES